MDKLAAAPPLPGVLGEYRGRTLIIFGAFVGLIAGIIPLLTYSFGVFASELGKTYGWSHGDMALSMSAYSLVLFLGSALIGRLADAVGAGKVAAASLLAMGCALIALPFIVHDVKTFWLAYALVTLAGVGTTPVVMLKPVVAAFSGQRGTASGIVLCGTGVGAIVMPPLVNALIEAGGWRMGYFGLGAVAIAASPVIWLTLARRKSEPAAALAAAPVAEATGLGLREAFRHREFWLLSVIALLASLALSAMIAHLVPVLRDLGATAAAAAGYASLLGVASIAGRLGSGLALDRFRGPWVGLMFMGSGAAGILLLALFGVASAVPAILLIGFSLGSEIDLLAYLISRYFGLRHHGSIFGWTYGVLALGSIFSPYLAGVLRDRQGAYGLAMGLMIACLALSGALCLLLGRYRYAVK